MINNNKIIIFIVFVSCALMTSLFIYHATHKQHLHILADGNVTLFPVARDIQPFELISTENKKFTRDNFIHHWSIVFFGFTHCASICPATLEMLDHAYTQLHIAHPNLQIIVITLDPNRDSPTTLFNFTHSFNSNFIGLTGKIQNIHKLQSQLGVFSGHDEASTSENYQIQHSANLFLINPEGKWIGIFKNGMSADKFVNAFTASVEHHA